MNQVNELIKQKVAALVQKYLPDLLISVNEVKVSKDLSYAKVWISELKDVDFAVKECQKLAKEFQSELAKTIELRKVPKLHFVPDLTSTEVQKIENLLRKIKEK